MFIFSEKRKSILLPLFFLSLSELKSGTMPVLCVSEGEHKTFSDPHLCEIFLSRGRFSQCYLGSVTKDGNKITGKLLFLLMPHFLNWLQFLF